MDVTTLVGAICAVVGILIGGTAAYFICSTGMKRSRERAGQSADQILDNANKEAEKKVAEAKAAAELEKSKAALQVKEELLKGKGELDREVKAHEREVQDRRNELRQQERRIQQKEENLDRKTDQLERRNESLNSKHREADELQAKLIALSDEQTAKLQQIAGWTTEQAKEFLLRKIEQDVTHEAAVKLRETEARFKEEADDKAREYITQAIQRLSSDYITDAAVSTVPLPNDEMKGRIIGREGRNIRALENLTGVDLVIDDTPEAITISNFDPYKREVARLTLEKLILDGRIQPTRIEEAVERSKREIEASMKIEGERAMFETGVHGLHPEIVKTLGRLRYRTSYGQNVMGHSIEVANLTGLMAQMLGADVTLAKRAGLLHDLGKAIDKDNEGTHISLGVELARKYREHAEVIHAIESHHGDVPPRTIIACLVQAADALSASRPGARRENMDAYVKRLEKLEEITTSFPGIHNAFVIQAGREVRVMVKPDDVSEDAMILLAREIAGKIEKDMEYPGQIKVNLMRETRAVEYAK
ncbi:MAG: ribonuclease Y [Oscillospiraceae bacterium]|jgi:ribonuclease Y|nr:ribonuclease Y [Oscillospiraceae bacterium]